MTAHPNTSTMSSTQATATYSRKRVATFDLDLPLIRRPFELTASNPRQRRPRTSLVSAAKPRLTQLTIDLGGSPQRRCGECGMEYVPANPEDADLHKRYHALNAAGIRVTRAFWTQVRTLWRGARREPRMQVRSSVAVREKRRQQGEDCIVEVTRKDVASARSVALRVVDIVEKELGAVQTTEKELWDTVDVETVTRDTGLSVTDERRTIRHDRYKVYLYIQDSRCVGCVLAERITSARRVCVPPAETEGSPITLSDETIPAILGISRIWVLREWRQRGVAQELLRAAQGHFVRDRALQKTDMAFSQPTERGTALARTWFGARDGWLVYT